MEPLSPDLVIHPRDVWHLKWFFDRLPPGGLLGVRDSMVYYQPVHSGVTRLGHVWHNVHLAHGENMTYWHRPRAVGWLGGDNGLDVGCGFEKVMDSCIGIDSGEDWGDKSDSDYTCDARDMGMFEDGQFDWIYSGNLLEHIGDWEVALDEMLRVLKQEGVIYLAMPWVRFSPWNSTEHIETHVWDPSPEVMEEAFLLRGVEVLEVDSEADAWGQFVIIGKK